MGPAGRAYRLLLAVAACLSGAATLLLCFGLAALPVRLVHSAYLLAIMLLSLRRRCPSADGDDYPRLWRRPFDEGAALTGAAVGYGLAVPVGTSPAGEMLTISVLTGLLARLRQLVGSFDLRIGL